MADQTLQPAASYSPPPVDNTGTLLPAQNYSPPPQQAAPQAPQQGGQQPQAPQQQQAPTIPKTANGTIDVNSPEYKQWKKEQGIMGWGDYDVRDALTGVGRSLATTASSVLTGLGNVTGVNVLDRGADLANQYLEKTAPTTAKQQRGYSVGDQTAGMLLTHGIEKGLNLLELGKLVKAAPIIGKLAEENSHIASIIGKGLQSGTANATTTAMMGGSPSDIGNAAMMGAGMGGISEIPQARAASQIEAATKYAPKVTDIGGQKFTEVSQAARDKGITTQEQEPGLQEQNQQSYQTLRDQALRERAAQGTAQTVNAMEPEEPNVSIAGAQRLKAKTSVSTAGPEKPITDASPREIDQSQRYLQKIIDSKKFPQGIKDRAQAQLDRINNQVQAREDWRNNPDNFRTETPIDPKVLMQNSTNFGEFSQELQRQAERRTPDMQWHERQYDNNGQVKVDASGNEVWKPVDITKMSRTELDGGIADGDLAKRDVRGLSKVDVQQGLRLGRMAEAAQQLDDKTQKIYDLSRERAEAIRNQTNQPDLKQEQRTANMQGHIDDLEALAKKYGPEFNDMFGRKDGITDLIAAAQKIAYADNGAKYSGRLTDFIKDALKKRASFTGKGGLGMGVYALSKAIGLKGSLYTLGAQAVAEGSHRQFMHQIATDPDFAQSVLTKDRSFTKGLRLTTPLLNSLVMQGTSRDALSKRIQSGQSSQRKRDID